MLLNETTWCWTQKAPERSINRDAGIPTDAFVQVFPLGALTQRRHALTHLEFGHKAGELLVPVVERGGRRDDQERTPDVVSLRGEQRRGHITTGGLYLCAADNRKPQEETRQVSSCERQFSAARIAFDLS